MKHGGQGARTHEPTWPRRPRPFEPQRGRHGRGRRGTPAITGRLAALHVLEGAFGDDGAAVASGTGPDLDEVVGLAQDPDVVVDDDLRVAVREQAADDAEEAVDVGGVQADRELVQDVQDTRGPVADRAGQRDAPAFSGGQRGRGAVEGGGDVGEIDVVDEAGAGLLAQPGAVAIWRALR